MAKTTSKKTSVSSSNKAVENKKPNANEVSNGNKKTKSATSSKSVSKKDQLEGKKQPVKSDSKKESSKKIRKVPKGENPIVLTEAVIPTTPVVEEPIATPVKEIDYNTVTFVLSDEVSFFKPIDNALWLKLAIGVTVRKVDDLTFELKGKLPDGNTFGTMLPCNSTDESTAFMNQLVNYVSQNKISILGEETTVSNNVDSQESKKEVNPADSYSGVPLKTENMDVLINSMKQNEQNDAPKEQPSNNVHKMSFNPIMNNMSKAAIVEPPLPNNENFHSMNAIIPSQNPQLGYEASTNQNNSSQKTEQDEFNAMMLYGKSIEHNLNETFQARIQGGLPISEFKASLNNCLKEYSYDVKTENNKHFLIISKGDVQIRIPENPEEFLKVY